MYDTLLDHELDDDSTAAEVDAELTVKSLDNDDDEIEIDIVNADKAEAAAALELDDESSDSESWSDDPVRMYLTQMGEIPLLTRQQEINLARRIETTRTAFRRRLLACDYVIRAAYKVLRRVHRGELPFDRTVQVSVTDRLEKEQILGRLPHNLATLETLLERNAHDYAIATCKNHRIGKRRAAWARLAQRRRRAVMLVEELGLRTQRI
ncbi:MAG: sigma-70 factor domain-containing protein, partial [Planctomycetota bacterium]